MFHSDTHVDLALAAPPKAPASVVTRTQILAALAVSLGSMIVGYSSAWSSPAIASLMEPGSGLEVLFAVSFCYVGGKFLYLHVISRL